MIKEPECLFIIGGITPDNYALRSFLAHRWVRNRGYESVYKDGKTLAAIGGKDSKYLKIQELDCEQFLDSKTLKILQSIWLLGLPFKFWDRLGDYLKALADEKRLKKISEYITSEIEKTKKETGSKVDVIGHSLGALLAMGIDSEIRNLYLMGCPITSRHWAIRTSASRHAERNCLIEPDNIYYLWNHLDRICTKPLEEIEGIKNIECFEGQYAHGLDTYSTRAFEAGVLEC